MPIHTPSVRHLALLAPLFVACGAAPDAADDAACANAVATYTVTGGGLNVTACGSQLMVERFTTGEARVMRTATGYTLSTRDTINGLDRDTCAATLTGCVLTATCPSASGNGNNATFQLTISATGFSGTGVVTGPCPSGGTSSSTIPLEGVRR